MRVKDRMLNINKLWNDDHVNKWRSMIMDIPNSTESGKYSFVID